MLNILGRRTSVQRAVEFAANLTIVVAIIIGLGTWLHNLRAARSTRSTRFTPAVNRYGAIDAQIVLPSIEWSDHHATLVVAISSACHYCVASTPFYSQITQITHAGAIVVVMPQEQQDAEAFLREHAITPNKIVSADLATIHVAATPTLLLVSSSGIVKRAWVGQLTDSEQLEVISSLNRT